MDISYVDLAVARAFEATISNWYEGLEKNKELPFRGFSKFLAPLVALSARSAAIVAAAIFLTVAFSTSITTNSNLYHFGLISAALLLIVNMISIRIANLVENSIERRRPLSAVLLCPADDRLLIAQKRQIWKSIGSSIGGILGSIAISLIAAYIAGYLGLS